MQKKGALNFKLILILPQSRRFNIEPISEDWRFCQSLIQRKLRDAEKKSRNPLFQILRASMNKQVIFADSWGFNGVVKYRYIFADKRADPLRTYTHKVGVFTPSLTLTAPNISVFNAFVLIIYNSTAVRTLETMSVVSSEVIFFLFKSLASALFSAIFL